MILCSMTATFGKLDGEALSFSPGLNLITAPNEWGKSTWCAFLLAMLYGIDTRQRARQGQLPDQGAGTSPGPESPWRALWRCCGRIAALPFSGRPRGAFPWATFAPLRRKPVSPSRS